MPVSFLSLTNQNKQTQNVKKQEQSADVAAIIAQNNKIKKHETTDAAAVLAMSSQPPLLNGQKDLCLA